MSKTQRELRRIHMRSIAMSLGCTDQLIALARSVKFNERNCDPEAAAWWKDACATQDKT